MPLSACFLYVIGVSLTSFDCTFKTIKLSIISKMQNSFPRWRIFNNQPSISFNVQRNNYGSVRRPDSLPKPQRKSIFTPNSFSSSIKQDRDKRLFTHTQPTWHIQQIIEQDDICGCQNNLEPCRHIQQLLKQANEKDMREQYIRLQSFSQTQKRSFVQIRQKYFKYLPSKYPEIYHAHLTNILSNLVEELTIDEFYTLAWIEYHAKLEHLTYFLFSDLKKSVKNKKKFIGNLEVQLIKHEVTYTQLLIEAKQLKLPLEAFLSDFYESVGATIVPLTQYALFLKLLLRSGSKIKLKLLILLIVKKKQTLFNLVKHYAYSPSSLRQQSNQLDWQLLFDELLQMH